MFGCQVGIGAKRERWIPEPEQFSPLKKPQTSRSENFSPPYFPFPRDEKNPSGDSVLVRLPGRKRRDAGLEKTHGAGVFFSPRQRPHCDGRLEAPGR
jgi:hypothetical protein